MITELTMGQALLFPHLPIDVLRLIMNGECLCYGEVEYERLQSIAVFTGSSVLKNDVVLRYIWVEDSLRYQGMATALLEYCYAVFRKENIQGVYVKLNKDRYEIHSLDAFLRAEQFTPVCREGKCLGYNLGMIEKSEVMQQVISHINGFPKTESLEDWNRKEIHSFLVRNRENGFSISKTSHNSELSRIYKQGDTIRAMMLVGNSREEYIVSQIYLEHDVDAKLLIPAFLAELFTKMHAVDRSKILKLMLYNETDYRGMKVLFGTPLFDTVIYEYYYLLRRK